MLLENIEYPNSLPFYISFSNVAEEDFHYHNELEMLLVLRGTTKCKIHNVLYTLSEGDVLIIDTLDMHRIFDSSPDILILDTYIDLSVYDELYPNIEYMIFACEDYSKASSLKYQDLQKKVSILKNHIAKTALAYMNDRDDVPILMDCMNDLIFTLVNQFQGFLIEDNKFKADTGGPGDIDLSRLYTIIKYIYLNYNKKITLEDLADIVYLNPYYISHLIKNTSGLSFHNFLSYVRLEYAEKHLVESQLTLTQISESCGFSSPSYFNKCFKNWYGMTPSQYRARLNPCERRFHGPVSKETAISLLRSYLMKRHERGDSDLLSMSSHHIFIPIKANFRSGKAFRKAFPLKIRLSSFEEILMLSYQKDNIKMLDPHSIFLDYKAIKEKHSSEEVLSILSMLQSSGLPVQVTETGTDHPIKETTSDANTVCSAYANIMKNPDQYLSLSGTAASAALFTPEGLLTPYYSVYSVFSQINGTITGQRDQYMIIKSDEAIYVLIVQKDKESKLKAHINIKDIKGKKIVIEKCFTQGQSCYETLRTLDYPTIPDLPLKNCINAISAGTVRLTSFDVKESLDLNFELEPGAFTFIEIRS